jgi:hypothetical protein
LISTSEFRAINLYYARNVTLYKSAGLIYIMRFVPVPFNYNLILKNYMINISQGSERESIHGYRNSYRTKTAEGRGDEGKGAGDTGP